MSGIEARLKLPAIQMAGLGECMFLDLYQGGISARQFMTAHGLPRQINALPVKTFNELEIRSAIEAYIKERPMSSLFILSETLSEDALALIKLCLKAHSKSFLICLEISGNDSLSMLRILSDDGETIALDKFLELTRWDQSGFY